MARERRKSKERRYCMPDPSATLIDAIIMEQIQPRSRVLDLGCGDGRLLASLRDQHQAIVQGIELDRNELRLAVSRGVAVIQADLDEGLEGFPDGSFDFA